LAQFTSVNTKFGSRDVCQIFNLEEFMYYIKSKKINGYIEQWLFENEKIAQNTILFLSRTMPRYFGFFVYLNLLTLKFIFSGLIYLLSKPKLIVQIEPGKYQEIEIVQARREQNPWAGM
jgi:hypothetical protein